jgi:sigma-B regulation protein RsbQ
VTDALTRNNVTVLGHGTGRALVFAHGLGCDQNVWASVAPAFAEDRKVVLFDNVGAGGSDLAAYDFDRYGSLRAYADDVLEICDALGLADVAFVGHSMGAIVGALAAAADPSRFAGLVLLAPSPRFVDAPGYTGGLAREDVDDLLEALDRNYLGWSSTVAPVIMGNAERPELAEGLRNSFCRTDPAIAQHAARVVFECDHRDDLPRVRTRSLILQCSDDTLAPLAVGEYMHARMPDSELAVMSATGHCPHLSAPEETVAAIGAFL